MQLKIFVIWDSKAEAYLGPWFLRTKGEFLREFQTMANDPQSKIGRWPGDHTAFYLGEFYNDTAAFSLAAAPESLGSALEYVEETEFMSAD